MTSLRSSFSYPSYFQISSQDDDGEEEEEEDLAEIDPSAIRSRRTRGIRVDYTSPAALEKAGLTKEELEREDEEMKI
jgi:hypothetical protein